jgi:hypothetical protein
MFPFFITARREPAGSMVTFRIHEETTAVLAQPLNTKPPFCKQQTEMGSITKHSSCVTTQFLYESYRNNTN